MKLYHFLSLFFLVLGFACSDDSNSPATNNPQNPNGPEPGEIVDGWLIPRDEVFDGGPGRDGIPSIDNPKFSNVDDVNFLSGSDLIMGIRKGDEIKAYPHRVLDWHEIVNDGIGNLKYALTYCPLTGTGVGWDRIFEGKETTFGVSGLLYNTNLMPYDRETSSTWSQQRLDCVNGERIGEKAVLTSFVETTWAVWKAAYPDSKVLNTDTGISRNYQRFPYGDYRTNNSAFLFPRSRQDNRLPAKDRVLGVRIGEIFKAYPESENNQNVELKEDQFNGSDLLIVRSRNSDVIVAFLPEVGRTYEALAPSDFPFILKDDQGVRYDMLGYASDGSFLELPDQFRGYWFSWAPFYGDLEIFEG